MGAEWMPGADRDPRTWACYGMSQQHELAAGGAALDRQP